MQTTDRGVKTALMGNAPQELISEIERMRRDPARFHVTKRGCCSLGCDKKGQRSTYQLSCGDVQDAGTWCPVHGWLHFDSTALPPTERLKHHEVEERELATRRKRGPRVRAQ